MRYTVLPLSIQTLCKLHRHVALPNDIIFSIRRLHSKHLDCEHAVASNLHDVTLHLSLNQCWKTLLFKYLAAIRYIHLHYSLYIRKNFSRNTLFLKLRLQVFVGSRHMWTGWCPSHPGHDRVIGHKVRASNVVFKMKLKWLWDTSIQLIKIFS